MRASRIVVPASAFVLVAAVTFALTHAPAGSVPATSEEASEAASAPIGVAVPFTFTGNPEQAAERWIADDQSARDAASEAGSSIGSHERYVPASHVGSAAPESPPSEDEPASADSLPADAGALPLTPSEESAPAVDGVVDLCAGDELPDYCPDGTGGTILFSLDAMPPFDGMVSLTPHSPGTAPYAFYPECAPRDLPGGSVQIGMTVNRPASIELSLFSPGEDGEWRRVDYPATTASSDARWQEWFDSDEATATDPDQWIHVCTIVSDLEPGIYEVRATFTDVSNPDLSFDYPADSALELRLLGDTGTLADAGRRPTAVHATDGDYVIVNATLNSSAERLTMRAVRMADGWLSSDEACRAEYATSDDALGLDVRVGVPLHLDRIPTAVLEAADYAYRVDHDASATHEFRLEEGTDYTLCLYWMDTAGSVDDSAIVAVEAIPVSTPEAYRVGLELVSAHDTWGALDGRSVRTITVGGLAPSPVYRAPAQCGGDIVGTVGAGPGEFWDAEDLTLCTGLTGVARMVSNGGVLIYTGLQGVGDDIFTSRTLVYVDPRCPESGCSPRASELAMIPLAEVPIDQSQCRSGFGSVCSDSLPTRSAGLLGVLVHYVHTEGNGHTSFRVGEPQFGERDPWQDVDLAEVRVTREPMPGWREVEDGVSVRVDVSLEVDDIVRVGFVILPGDPEDDLCIVRGADSASASLLIDPATDSGSVVIHRLCAGASYRIVAYGPSGGAPLLIQPATGWTPQTSQAFVTDQIRLDARVELRAQRERDLREGQTAYSTVTVTSPYSPGLHGVQLSPFDWGSRGTDWVFDEDALSACGGADTDHHYLENHRGAVLVSHGELIQVRGNAQFNVNTIDPATGEYTCMPTRDAMSLNVYAEVTLEQLVEGFTIEEAVEPPPGTPNPHTFIRIKVQGFPSAA